ncbi:hypothetical protein [Streptomyces sp. NPDC088923]|uniref:hypothetical protein n=1 Tax=Streptomyces sp. NPDC088923 TaxID=3365913 RepID=UPI0038119429
MSREGERRENLRGLKRFADELESSVDNVEKLCGTDTWKGPGSERLRGEFSSHKQRMKDAPAHARAAMDRALKRVEREEAEKKRSGAGK